MLRLAHISDCHFLNNSRHLEFREYLKLLDIELSKLDVNYIIVTGDIFHSKTNLTPDAYQLAFEFFKMLGEHATVLVILGNHDLAERNLSRLDALTPVISNIETKVEFLKFSGDLSVGVEKDKTEYIFRTYSLLDRDKWNWTRDGISNDSVLIGLYHGPVKGSTTDIGFIFNHGEDINNFDCLDVGLLGDIHKSSVLGNKKHIAYAGSLIQNTFGDNLSKGFLYWEINPDKTFTNKFIELHNIYPFITLNVGDSLNLNKDNIKGIRIRIISDKSLNETNDYIKTVKQYYGNKIISLVYSNKPQYESLQTKQSKILSFNEFIDKRKDKEELKKVHEEYLQKLNIISNSTNWKIKSLKWNNLFSYGENNEINFDKYNNQIIGFMGSNFSGKTSTLSIITFALFGTWTNTGFVKAIHYINNLKDKADCEIVIEINGKEYSIKRTLEKVTKGNKIDCKASLTFIGLTDKKEMNADTSPLTQAAINKLIGTIEDFSITSLSTQFNNFAILDEKNTKRKEYFSKFLGITQYEEAYKLVKEDLKDLKKELDILNKYKTTNNIKEAEDFIKAYADKELELKTKHKELYVKLYSLKDKIDQLNVLDKAKIKLTAEYNSIISLIEINKRKINNLEKNIFSLKERQIHTTEFDNDRYNQLKIEIKEKDSLYKEEINTLNNIEKKLKEIEKAESLLASVPCGTQFLTCKFLSHANALISEKPSINDQLVTSQLNKTVYNVQKYNLETEFNALDKIKEDNVRNQKSINDLEFKEKQLKELKEELAKTITVEDIYIEKLKEYDNIWSDCKPNDLDNIKEEINQLNIKLSSLSIKNEFYKKQIETVNEQNNKIKELEIRYQLLDDYSELVGKNGIIISILDNYLPAITQLTNEIIANITDLKIDIKIEEDKYLEMYIIDHISKRPVECASGSQKTIISLALRLAILNYSQICSSDLMIMDEPATALDADHLLQFNKLLDIIKSYGKTILLVTHIDLLKDSVDKIYTIDKSTGFSRLLE